MLFLFSRGWSYMLADISKIKQDLAISGKGCKA